MRGRRFLKLAGWAIVLLIAGAVLAAWAAGWVGVPRAIGFYAPLFTPDGGAVVVVKREVRVVVSGPGYEFFTPPANVRYLQDRFTLLNVRIADGTVTTVETFSSSPLEGTTITAYHGAIFGRPDVHLRWADPAHLEFEIAVTRPSTPFSRTFVTRRMWDPRTSAFISSSPWEEGPTRMAGGYEPQQLHGALEVLAVPGTEAVPCAIVLWRTGDSTGRALLDSGDCRARRRSVYPAEELGPLSRRKEIEAAEHVRSTYAALIERGLRAGMPEIQAHLAAGREMERLGLYPKTPKLIAAHANCGDADPLFAISDDEFRAGLFQDIEQAIARPGEPVEKDDAYVRHNAYTTSERINAWIKTGHSQFFVKAQGSCWNMTIDK